MSQYTKTKNIAANVEKKLGEYDTLAQLEARHIEALASLRASPALEAIFAYLELRITKLRKDLDLLGYDPTAKANHGAVILFNLQDTQSRMTEDLHLRAIFDKANELINLRKKA